MKRLVSVFLTFALICAAFCVFTVPAKADTVVDQSFGLWEQYQEIMFVVTEDNLLQRIELDVTYEYGAYIFQTLGTTSNVQYMALFDADGERIAYTSGNNGFSYYGALLKADIVSGGYYLEIMFECAQIARLTATYAETFFVTQPDLWNYYDIETYDTTTWTFYFDAYNKAYAQVILVETGIDGPGVYKITSSGCPLGKLWLMNPCTYLYEDGIMIDGEGEAEIELYQGVQYYMVGYIDFGWQGPNATYVESMIMMISFEKIC